jgi:uncharacterized protein
VTAKVTFQSLDGLSLEGAAEAPIRPKAAAVLCHPHPEMGGTMNAPLLVAVRDELLGRGWGVLRFNFRGVGASQGRSSLGTDEVADVRGALAFVRDRWPRVAAAIAGWSFGAAVAVRAAVQEKDVRACACVAPAVKQKPGVTAGLPAAADLDLTIPVLVVCGTNDELVSADDGRQWARALPRSSFVEVKGANHFFWGKYDELSRIVGEFLDEAVSQ